MMPTQPKRIVIYRLGSLGDTIVALPCFNKIVDRYPDAERIALTNIPVSSNAAPLESILEGGGFIHQTIRYRVGIRSLSELWALRNDLRALNADTLIYLGGGRPVTTIYRDILFFRACGFRRIIGAPTTKRLSFGDSDAATGLLELEGSRLARCLAALGPIDPGSPGAHDLRLTPMEKEKGAATLQRLCGQPFFALNMGGKGDGKDWGTDKWRQLLARVAPHLQMGLVIVGAAEDRERARRLGRLWRQPIINICGELNPRETAAVLGHADFFIGHDSGPLHLAAAMGVRCVGLYGSSNQPNKWHPAGSHHVIFHDVQDIGRIRAADVERAVLRLASQKLRVDA